MKILVVDGQGGRIGAALIEGLLAAQPDASLIAVGTNVAATQAMRKAGAAAGATGENAVCVNAARADVIAGPIGIIAADALLGEITPRMAEAISPSGAGPRARTSSSTSSAWARTSTGSAVVMSPLVSATCSVPSVTFVKMRIIQSPP